MKSRILIAVAACLSLLPWQALAQARPRDGVGENWVTTWATAEQLAPMSFGRMRGRRSDRAAQPAPPRRRAAPRRDESRGPGPALPSTFADQTVRMIVRSSIGGRRVRVDLSNMTSAEPLPIGAAHIAVYKGDGAIVEGTDRVLTFSGSQSFTIPPGVLAVSDPVDLEVAPLTDLAVSLYLPNDTGSPTNHQIGLRTAYISKGNVTGSATMPDPAKVNSYVWLSSVDVVAPADSFTIVALGDSITDGYGTKHDAESAWPALLAKRLQENKATQHVAVINQGVSGNQVMRDGAGVSALARFDRDVLSRPGVKWVALLEGINDINIRGRSDGPDALTAEELIGGYKQIIARCHMYGIKVIGATLTPEEGVPTASERGEAIRLEANKWIRAKGNFDAVVDFDAVIRDPERPIRMRPELDPGDHIHPNDAGNQTMADAFDLSLFGKQ